MAKLLNGRPMSELKAEPHRPVLGIDKNGKIVVFEPDYIPFDVVEWAEIIKPEPKPDANGWWRFADKMPESRSIVQLAIRCSKYGSNHRISTVIYDAQSNYDRSFTHWKFWEGPVE